MIKLEGSEIWEGRCLTEKEIAERQAERDALEASVFEAAKGQQLIIESADGNCEGTWRDFQEAVAAAQSADLKAFFKRGYLFFEDGFIKVVGIELETATEATATATETETETEKEDDCFMDVDESGEKTEVERLLELYGEEEDDLSFVEE